MRRWWARPRATASLWHGEQQLRKLVGWVDGERVTKGLGRPVPGPTARPLQGHSLRQAHRVSQRRSVSSRCQPLTPCSQTPPRRLPTSHPTLIKFSAPLFLSIGFTSFGLSLGHSTTCSFVACMGKQVGARWVRRAGVRGG